MDTNVLDTSIDWDTEVSWDTAFTGKRRHPIALFVSCRPAPKQEMLVGPLRTKNISLGGIGFVSERPFEVDSLWMVEVLGVNGQRILEPTLARVVHSTAQTGETYLIGCEFLKKLEVRALRGVLAV